MIICQNTKCIHNPHSNKSQAQSGILNVGVLRVLLYTEKLYLKDIPCKFMPTGVLKKELNKITSVQYYGENCKDNTCVIARLGYTAVQFKCMMQ